MSHPTFTTAGIPGKAPPSEPRAVRVPLRVLLVEDSEDDAAIVLRLLRRGGYEPSWLQVQTQETLTQALVQGPWDIVLSDFNMPQFDGLRALQVSRTHAPHVPFIMISGSIGEETAVEAIRAGADDYLMKTNLVRLVPAIERELREAGARSERARTGRALVDLQEKFEVIFDEYLDIMMVLDAFDGGILHVNNAVSRVTGYDPDKITGQDFLSLWPAGDARAQAARTIAAVQETGSALQSGVFARVDGSSFPVDIQANMVPWEGGQAIVVTLRDVTEQQRAEQSVAHEREQLAVTLRSIGEGVITTDTEGRLQLINGVAEHLTGWTQAEAAGCAVGEVLRLVNVPGGEGVEDPTVRVLASGSPVEISRDLALRSRDGRERSISLTAAPIRGRRGQIRGVVTIFRDVTNERKHEDELLRASRLESVALLAGGVAHDFNNILTAILGHLDMAKNHTLPAEDVLGTVERACHYATDLTRQLLTFAKDRAPARRIDSLAEIVRASVEFGLHGTHLRCEFDLPEDLHLVEVDRVQIQQVVNNLVLNAAQATPERGLLRVSASNIAVTRERPVATLVPGLYVQLVIEDNGSGISPEHLSRIFDPYFTTKKTGSGLGLAAAYSIIQRHGGSIRAESEPRHGTTFFVYLPASPTAPGIQTRGANTPVSTIPSMVTAAPVSMDKAEPVDARSREPRTEAPRRILFMDDEEILQELVSAMLDYLGYEVTGVGDGEAAIAEYQRARAEDRPYAAVIVDLTVPGGMGGYEAVQKLRVLDPGVKAVVSSGYSNDPLLTNYREHGFSGFIAKPYQMAELDQTLREVIEPKTAK